VEYVYVAGFTIHPPVPALMGMTTTTLMMSSGATCEES